MASRAKQIHVVPHGKDGWGVKKAGASRNSAIFRTKQDAVDNARKASTAKDAELVIHGMKGRIQRRDSHGGDPHPPKG